MNRARNLSEAVNGIRLENARLINRIRAVALMFFLSSLLVMSVGLGNENWRPGPLEWIYFGIAVLYLAAGEIEPRSLGISRFAVPMFDMPMVFAIQLKNLDQARTLYHTLSSSIAPGESTIPEEVLHRFGGQVAEFTVALFVCLILLSGFTLRIRQVCLSLVVAAVLQQILYLRAGLTIGSHFNSLIVFGFATWICVFAGKNRLLLTESIARAEARRDRLRRYFSPNVADLLEKEAEDRLGEGREVELTVLFVDLREFTRMSETMDGPEVVELLNSCHSFLVDAIFRQGGTLDKYLGDGLMAYFNAPLPHEDHAERALRCALEMRKELRTLNERRASSGKAPLRLGIGIHTGPCVVGDIGAPHRREFTAIGQTVNLASRIESATKEAGVEILFSAATVERMSDLSGYYEVGDFEIRGSSRPLTLFSIH